MKKSVMVWEKKTKFSKFLILSYNHNQKLGNLGKFYLFITLFNVDGLK